MLLQPLVANNLAKQLKQVMNQRTLTAHKTAMGITGGKEH